MEEIIQNVYDEIVTVANLNDRNVTGYERFLIIDKAKWLDCFVEDKQFPPIQIDFQLSNYCNLKCRWCIGRYLKEKNGLETCKRHIAKHVVDRIYDEILGFNLNDLSVETIMFSGLTGEPLLDKEISLYAIKKFSDSRLRVGLFTNGTLMDKDTWEILTCIESVHISLDAGPKSWKTIKLTNVENDNLNFDVVISNIRGLLQKKIENNSSVEINIGYIVTADNIDELEYVIRLVSSMGVNSICIKHDITNSDFQGTKEEDDNITKIIKKCQEKYNGINDFNVVLMHDSSLKDSKSMWKCNKGCYYRLFFGTIGPEGEMYPCDYQTFEQSEKFGNLCDIDIFSVWENKQKQWDSLITGNPIYNNICPPFAEKINFFLHFIEKMKKKYGSDILMEVLSRIRENYG